MALALRMALCVVAAALLGGCHKTELPYERGSTPGRVSGSNIHAPYYTVRHGDTLYSIGRRFGVDPKLLASRNHVPYPYTIYDGQHIYLTRVAPKTASGGGVVSPARAGVRRKSPSVSSGKHTTAGGGGIHFRWPVNGTVTSGFGRRRSGMHDGVDIGVKRGTPIHAAAAGEVVYADQRLSGYGKMIIIRHGHDMFTAYAHNERNLVRKGDKVKSGDIIARVGSTGRASGPHLHFEVRRGTTPVNPMKYLPKQ